MPSKIESFSRYISLIATIVALISFFFPSIPDYIRHILLGVILVGLIVLNVKRFLPFDRFRLAYEANAQIYGYKYERLHISLVIGRQGSAVLTRTVKVVATVANLGEVYNYLMVPGSKENESDDLPLTVDLMSCDDPHRDPVVEGIESPEGHNRFKINISPPLGRDRSLQYALEEVAPSGTFAITRAELLEGLPYEYFAWEINRPTKELILEVKIPLSLGTQMHNPDVWRGMEFGHTTVVSEFDRISPRWEESTERLQGQDYLALFFKIPYPILGMRYVVKWVPMALPMNANEKAADNNGVAEE